MFCRKLVYLIRSQYCIKDVCKKPRNRPIFNLFELRPYIWVYIIFFSFKVTRTLAITGVMRVENAARRRSVVFLTLAQITPPAPIFVEKKPDSIFRTFLALAKKDSPMNQTSRAAVTQINVKKIPVQTMRHAVFVEHFFQN